MKKTFAIILTLCMVAALATVCFVSASAAADVTVGQRLYYNQAEKENQRAWRTSNLSTDGMWKYMFYIPNKNAYGDMKFCMSSGNYSWDGTTSTGTGPLDYILVRQNGLNFHPGKNGDVCKVFIAPVSGHITVETTIARQSDFTADSANTPTGFAVWVEEKQVYPTDGTEYEAFTSATPRTVTFETDIIEGQYMYIRINSIDGNNSGDGINMENFVTYSSIDTSIGPTTIERTTLGKPTVYGPTITIPTLHDPDATTTNNGGQTVPTETDSGSFPWWIIPVAVVVVGAVVAAVVIAKKKKSAE